MKIRTALFTFCAVSALTLTLSACDPAASADSGGDSVTNVSNEVPSVDYNDPTFLGAAVVTSFNQQAAKADSSIIATDATCIKTADQVFNCMIVFTDGTQMTQAVNVSADGQTFMAKNS